MSDLDLSELTDDQLITMFRAVLREAASRQPAVRAAVEAAGIDEAERLKIIKDATERESAKLRAQERERIAREAAAAVQAGRAKQEEEISRMRANDETARKVQDAENRGRITRSWLAQFAAIVGRDPSSISLLLLDTRYGRRVLVNDGGDSRYASDHLVDYNSDANTIKTTRELVGKKPEALALCASFAAVHTGKTLALLGADQIWPKSEPQQAAA